MEEAVMNRPAVSPRPVAIALLLLLLLAGTSFAEPYIAVRTGFKCSQCHENRTGGGKRTDFGVAYSQYKLMMKSMMGVAQAQSFDPKLTPTVSVGANFRIEQTWLQAATSKKVNTGDSVRTAPSTWDAGTFKEKNLYVNMDLVKDRLKLYYDKDMGGGTARELWAMVGLPGSGYFKFGQMLLPYGFRLMDDEAFVRKGTGYTYGTTALAYELGFEPGPLSLVVNATQNEVATVGSLVFQNLPVARTVRVGGSHSYQLRKAYKSKKGSYGVFGGLAFGMFTVLGERDWTRDEGIDKIEDYAEIAILPMQGLNFRLVYESLWPDRNIPQAKNNQRRITFGAEPFVTQYLQVGLYYRKNDWIPQNPEKNQDEVVGRLHVFF